MDNVLQSGYSLYYMAWFFVFYSFLGWCVEVCFNSIQTKKFVNRGFLNGPVCPIYGFGVVAVLILLHPFIDNILLLFIGSVLVTSLLELLTGFLLNVLFQTKWWDYSNQNYNIGGYVCLRFSLLWGVGCVFLLKVFHPLVASVLQMFPYTPGLVLLLLMGAALLVDAIVTVNAISKLNRDLGAMSYLAKNFHKGSEALAENLGNRAISIAEKVSDFDLEEQKQKIATQLDDSKEQMRAGVEDSREKINLKMQEIARKTSHIGQRLLKAFPNMQSHRNKDALEELKKRLAIPSKQKGKTGPGSNVSSAPIDKPKSK